METQWQKNNKWLCYPKSKNANCYSDGVVVIVFASRISPQFPEAWGFGLEARQLGPFEFLFVKQRLANNITCINCSSLIKFPPVIPNGKSFFASAFALLACMRACTHKRTQICTVDLALFICPLCPSPVSRCIRLSMFFMFVREMFWVRFFFVENFWKIFYKSHILAKITMMVTMLHMCC